MIVTDVFIFVLLILAIVFGSRILREWIGRHSVTATRPVNQDTRLLAEEVARLRERVHVLERIITDNHDSLDLGSRIERLRDR